MADSMKGLKRTHYCGEVTEIGKEVVVGGFVERIRDKGGVIFIVLRDRTGVVQLMFNDKTDPAVFEKAASLANNAQFSPLYLFKAGLAYEAKSDNAKALKAYETIKTKWADSELANTIDKYIVRVK